MTEDILVQRVTEDRISHLFRLFEKHPIHQVYKIFKDRYNVGISLSDLEKIYNIWYADRRYANSVPLKVLRKTEWWPPIELKIRNQTAQDLSNFIYNHWRKAGNI